MVSIVHSNGLNRPAAGQGDGVYVDCSTYTTVTNCTIDSNRGWGTLLTNSGHSTVTNNTFQGNGLGGSHTT